MGDSPAKGKIAIGADHGGFELKEHLKRALTQRGYEVVDCGTHSTASVDYPQFAAAVARRVADGTCRYGIMIDGAGIGSSMVANKISGVRAALCYDVSSARNSREHNDANVLTLGAGLVGRNLAEQIVDVWLTTECTEPRHRRRVAMIDQLGKASGQPGGDRACACGEGASCTCGGGAADAAIDESDIERIVARIAEMTAGSTAPAAGDVACLFCKTCFNTNPEMLHRLVDAGATRVGHRPDQSPPPRELAKYIDHTLLKPEASADDVRKLCAEAREFGFASVCVNPTYVRLVARELAGTDVKTCAVVGFPLGAHLPDVKGFETRRAIRDGAREIDMVINVGALKSGDCELLFRDILAVTDACRERDVVSKVILETALLTDEEKVVACQIARRARADFVKTSTGFGPGGATAHDVALMAQAVRDAGMGVKASGGIRSVEDAEKMIAAGATRIGASASVKIVRQAQAVTVSG
ncbi:MAG: deoxyribose-phosphate aldolase [Planctomycetota bacterium]|nr:MAG: deoxyribose-phosphate aldolase [Planctomycetota bacterium]